MPLIPAYAVQICMMFLQLIILTFCDFSVDNCDIICYNRQGFDDFNQNNFLPCAEVGLYKPVIRTGVSTNCLKQFTICLLYTSKGIAMSRLGGGIGTRGPGETKLETDRRHIRRRIEDVYKRQVSTLSESILVHRHTGDKVKFPVTVNIFY